MSTETKSLPSAIDPDQPGSLALAVINETKDVVFKKPFPVAGSKRKIEILDEESYLEEIGKIIQRDFFPDLEKMKAQNAYLEAVENNDVVKLREIYSKYSIGRRPPSEACQSPATFETPVFKKIESIDAPKVLEIDDEKIDPSKSPDKEKRLDEFLKTHTSEDNESFEELVKEADIRQRAKHPWLFKNDCPALPPSSETLAIEDRPANIDTWAYKNKNYIMYVPDGVEFSKDEKLDMIKKKKEINYKATRLVECPFNEQQNKEAIQTLAHCQARVMDGKIGVDGKELSMTDTPNIYGYNFVKTPSPMPGVEESPLMTWGQIEGTPFRLDGSDTPIRPGLPGPVFKIAEPPKREKLAHALAEKAGEKNRDKKQKALEIAKKQLTMASPNVNSSPFERFDAVSPSTPRLTGSGLKSRADFLLLSPRSPAKKLKPTTPLRISDSPAPSSTSSSSFLNNQRLTDNLLNLNLAKRSDQNVIDNSPSINHSKRLSQSITDDLLDLKLPDRPKAADFFS